MRAESAEVPPGGAWGGAGDTHLLVRLLLLGHHSRLQGQLVPPSPPAHLGEGTELPPLRAPQGQRRPLHNGTGGTAIRPRPAAVRLSVCGGRHRGDPAPARGGEPADAAVPEGGRGDVPPGGAAEATPVPRRILVLFDAV